MEVIEMSTSIYGLNDYSYLFSSPVKTYQVNPVSNLIYGFNAAKIYSNTVAKKMSSTVSSYLSSMRTDINSVEQSADKFTAKGKNSLFSQKSISSQDSSITGTANSNAKEASYKVNVSSIAKSQINQGIKLKSDGETTLSAGIKTFTLNIGDAKKNIAFEVKADEKNSDTLSNIASAINNSKSGVTASVVNDAKTGESYLKTTSDKTGANNAFTFTDGEAVSTMQLNNIAQSSQDAVYSVDGKQYTSHENKVYLDNGNVALNMNNALGKDIAVTVGQDKDNIKDNINEFVKNYNQLIKFANSNTDNFKGAQLLSKEFSNIVKAKETSLNNVGVSIKSDGMLSVDTKKLEASITNKSYDVETLFSRSNGIGEKVSMEVKNVIFNPMKYLKPATDNYTTDNFLNYSNYSSMGTFYNKNSINNNMYSGLMVDSLL
jgi:flagellar hook-associated protein 2